MARRLARTGLVLLAVLALPPVARAGTDDDEWPAPLDGPPATTAPVELSQWGMGPFEVRDPSVLGELRASPMARSPRTLRPFELELGVRQTQESTYVYADSTDATVGGRREHRLTVDGETRDTNLVVRMGILPRIELGAALDAVHYQGGGYLDGLITSFHRTVGMGTLRRDREPYHSWIVKGTESNGREIDFGHTGTGLGDAVLSPRFLVLEGGDYHPAVAVGLSLWLPLASPRFEHGHGTAETFSIDASKRLGTLPIVLYAGGAYTYYDAVSVHGLALTRHRFMAYGGFEIEITSRVSLVTHFWQETLREKKLFGGTDIPKGNMIQYIASGIKFTPLTGLRIELGALESFDKSAGGDFGFLANLWFDVDAGAILHER
ncbi:MAG TPA: DUF3187 family protein [Planctomycetota bacterium]|nr:DUF3187 family protein [Planctomycetota bacterium]